MKSGARKLRFLVDDVLFYLRNLPVMKFQTRYTSLV
jgi:hypothetical protein